MEKITLRQLIEEAEQNGKTIEAGGFGSMADFFSYYDIHYKPLLEAMSEEYLKAETRGCTGDELEHQRMVSFLADDILAILKDKED